MSSGFWLFSYGTLQLADVQFSLFGRFVESHPDRLTGFTLLTVRISDESVIAVSGSAEHPILRPGTSEDSVGGNALRLTADDLAKADAYETTDYRRIAVELASGREAFVYVARGNSAAAAS